MRRSLFVALALSLTLIACKQNETAGEHAGHGTGDIASTTAASTSAAPSNPALDPQREAGPLVTFASGTGEATGYLTVPSAPGRKPALIVIHEWWGLDDWTREQADRLMQQGYVALAPDLYRGKSTKDPAEAHELMRGMPEDRAMADLRGAFNYLAARADVDPERIGVIGWCMGGGYALALATVEPRLKATVINYGRLVTEHDTIAKIDSAILGNFGGKDRGIPVEDVKKFGQALTRAGKLGDIKIYENAGHAFMNPNNKEGYDAEATRDAWARIDRFFGRTLRDKIPNS